MNNIEYYGPLVRRYAKSVKIPPCNEIGREGKLNDIFTFIDPSIGALNLGDFCNRPTSDTTARKHKMVGTSETKGTHSALSKVMFAQDSMYYLNWSQVIEIAGHYNGRLSVGNAELFLVWSNDPCVSKAVVCITNKDDGLHVHGWKFNGYDSVVPPVDVPCTLILREPTPEDIRSCYEF